MTSEITANKSSKWIKPLATWNIKKPPSHRIKSKIAIPKNGPNLIFPPGRTCVYFALEEFQNCR
jgi:hypothetical protein